MSRLSFFLLIVAICGSLELTNARVHAVNKQRLQERLCAVDSRYCEGLVAHDEPAKSEDNTEGGQSELAERNTDTAKEDEHNEEQGLNENNDDNDDNDNDDDDDEEDNEDTDLSEGYHQARSRRRNNRNVRRNRRGNNRRRGNRRNTRNRRGRRGRRGGRRRPNRRVRG